MRRWVVWREGCVTCGGWRSRNIKWSASGVQVDGMKMEPSVNPRLSRLGIFIRRPTSKGVKTNPFNQDPVGVPCLEAYR